MATVTLNRPERKNPLTFESYAELRDLFGQLEYADDVKAVVVAGAGGNFCSGGDVHEIIGPLVATEGTRAADVHAHDGRPRQGDARGSPGAGMNPLLTRLPATPRRQGECHPRADGAARSS